MSSTLAHQFDDAEQQLEAATLGMWVFLATEVLFFGGMFLGYVVYRSAYPAAFAEGSRHLDVVLGTVNTGILLLSSLTMALAVHAVQTNRSHTAVWFLVATAVLGLAFLGIKSYEYEHKFRENLLPGRHFCLSGLLEDSREPKDELTGTIIAWDPDQLSIQHDGMVLRHPIDPDSHVTVDGREGELAPGQAVAIIPAAAGRPETIRAVTPRVELFFSFYLAMTGFHALHMVIGICLVAVIAALARRGRFCSAYFTPVEMTGLYWHFVDVVWVFLFPLLYLIDLNR